MGQHHNRTGQGQGRDRKEKGEKTVGWDTYLSLSPTMLFHLTSVTTYYSSASQTFQVASRPSVS